MRKGPILAIVAVALAAAGCKVKASASVNAGGKAKVNDLDEPLDDSETAVAGFQADDDSAEDYALLGARHDVSLTASAAGQAKCSCLAVAVGSSSDSAFAWQSSVPRTDPDSQLVIALTSQGLPCQGAPENSLGASYWGYRRSGDDIVVFVENAHFGRPIAGGAIIPKPLGNGQVLVRPASKSVPYGRGPGDEKTCKLGNPGQVRTLDDSEDGSSRDKVEFED